MQQKIPKNGQNDPKRAKKLPTMATNGLKWSKWSEMFGQIVQMRRGIQTPNCLTKMIKNCHKMTEKWGKEAKNSPQ